MALSGALGAEVLPTSILYEFKRQGSVAIVGDETGRAPRRLGCLLKPTPRRKGA